MAPKRKHMRYKSYFEPTYDADDEDAGNIPRSTIERYCSEAYGKKSFGERPRPKSPNVNSNTNSRTGVNINVSGTASESESDIRLSPEPDTMSETENMGFTRSSHRPSDEDPNGAELEIEHDSEVLAKCVDTCDPEDARSHSECYEEDNINDGNGAVGDDGESDFSGLSSGSVEERYFTSDGENASEDAHEDDEDHRTFLVDETLNEVIHPGLQTTKAETLLMVMMFVMRHCLSSSAMVDLLRMLNEIFCKVVVPASRYLVEKVFLNKLLQFSFHFYCNYCKGFVCTYDNELADYVPCPGCNEACKVSDLSGGNFFMTTNLATQLKALFESDGVAEHLMYRSSRQKYRADNLEDIYDGEVYQNLKLPGGPLSNENNYSYSFNTDGMPVFHSAQYSMWPIYIIINELPPKVRNENVILAGLWFGKSSPYMNIFLEKFVEQAQELAENGIKRKNGEEEICSKVFGICCCADAPARASVQNTVQFNGYMGCSICYHPGKAVERVVKYPMDVDDYEDRTDEELLADMSTALDEGHSVHGVKGPTPIINMPFFPLVWGFPPDYMHCLLLGVIRQITELWLSSPAGNLFYIGTPNVLARIDTILSNIKTPSFVPRMPRAISERKFWKASEWHFWLIFYCLPCIQGVLGNPYFAHVVNLVEAAHLLLQKSVSREDINRADTLLYNFVLNMQLLYGERAMTFNVHCLTHIAKSVKMWGPLWTHSCFPFEAANGMVKKLLKGNRGVMMQAMNKFMLLKALPFFRITYPTSERVEIFCNNMTASRQRKSTESIGNIQMLGTGSSVALTPTEQLAFLNSGYQNFHEVVQYSGLCFNSSVYFSMEYRKVKKRNDRIFHLHTGEIGEIIKILCINEECLILYRKLELNDDYFQNQQSGAKVTHIRVCRQVGEIIHVVPATHLAGNCMLLECDEILYVCFPPNCVAFS